MGQAWRAEMRSKPQEPPRNHGALICDSLRILARSSTVAKADWRHKRFYADLLEGAADLRGRSADASAAWRTAVGKSYSMSIQRRARVRFGFLPQSGINLELTDRVSLCFCVTL